MTMMMAMRSPYWNHRNHRQPKLTLRVSRYRRPSATVETLHENPVWEIKYWALRKLKIIIFYLFLCKRNKGVFDIFLCFLVWVIDSVVSFFGLLLCTWKLRWLVQVSLFLPPPPPHPAPPASPPPHSDPVSAERSLLTAWSFTHVRTENSWRALNFSLQ